MKTRFDSDPFEPVATEAVTRSVPPRKIGREVVIAESAGLAALAEALDASFDAAVSLLHSGGGRVFVSGVGKSGHVARKIASTLSSTGRPACFIHPVEAMHGDLGMLCPGDVLIVLSNSGASMELRGLVDHAQRLSARIVAIGARPDSPLMRVADIALVIPDGPEACPVNIAPTTSTTMMLTLGDALAVAVMSARGIGVERIRLLHPGGPIGERLRVAEDVMRTDALPLVGVEDPMPEVLLCMARSGLGIAGVVALGGGLVGVIEADRLPAVARDLAGERAGFLMNRHAWVARRETPLDEIARNLGVGGSDAALVIAGENDRRPIGVVSARNLGTSGAWPA